MDLYWESIGYSFSNWKARIEYHEAANKNQDRYKSSFDLLKSALMKRSCGIFCQFGLEYDIYGWRRSYMIDFVLVLRARESLIIWASYKMFNITKSKTQLPFNMIEHTNLRYFRHSDYLAILRFKLLSYLVGVDP